MTAQDIDGKSIAAAVRAELTEKLASLPDGSSKPGLAVMLVGERKDSQVCICVQALIALHLVYF